MNKQNNYIRYKKVKTTNPLYFTALSYAIIPTSAGARNYFVTYQKTLIKPKAAIKQKAKIERKQHNVERLEKLSQKIKNVPNQAKETKNKIATKSVEVKDKIVNKTVEVKDKTKNNIKNTVEIVKSKFNNQENDTDSKTSERIQKLQSFFDNVKGYAYKVKQKITQPDEPQVIEEEKISKKEIVVNKLRRVSNKTKLYFNIACNKIKSKLAKNNENEK